MRRLLLALALLVCGAGMATAQVSGRANVLGSDTFSIGSRTFQLFGIDGVEFHQNCFINGRLFACGASATRAMQTLLDPVTVTCTPTGERNGAIEFATCTTSEGDVAENIVRQGWALAYRPQSDAYVAAEEAARAAQDGVWRGTLVEPWVYREDMAAIEQRYLERIMASLRTDAEVLLTTERAGIGIFAEFPIARAVDTIDRELRVETIAPGFITGAIDDRGVFDWPTVALALKTWRDKVVAGVGEAAQALVWDELVARPGPVVETTDEATFYPAMIAAAAPMIAAGRQPILLIAAPDNPMWVRGWFNEAVPAGAVVSMRDDAWPNYMGTIDGIDVYYAPVAADEALLVPYDFLAGLAYRTNADDTVVTILHDPAPQPDELVFRFSRSLTWTADEVVHIQYPYEVANPYEGGG